MVPYKDGGFSVILIKSALAIDFRPHFDHFSDGYGPWVTEDTG